MKVACGALVVVVLLAAASAEGAAPKAGAIVVESGHVKTADGASVAYEIGTLYVPENRGKPDSRLIGVGFARIKAPRPTGAPPVFWLPGGPGLSVLGAFTEPSEQSRLKAWLNFGAVADIVIVEQRGYTKRGEMLQSNADATPLDEPASVRADAAAMRALAKRAVSEHAGKDLSGYGIDAFAADVNDLRRALGYDKISLFGGSFGSQWSLAVMRLYPDIVARAVISSVEPLDGGFDMPSQVFAALQRIAFDADRDPSLAPYLPKGGLMTAVRELRQRLAKKSVRVSVRDAQGRARTVVLGAEDLQLALVSHTQEAAAWPAHILSLYHAHYEPWAHQTLEDRAGGPVTLIGPLVDSSLSATAERRHLLATDPAVDFLGTWNFEANFASADDWPTPDMGDDFRKPRVSQIPVVFVHGDWDTSTPIENTLELLPYFPKGHAIRVHRAGHDGPFYQLRENAEAKEAVYDFLKTGNMARLPTEVSASVPKFDVPPFPPPSARSR